MNTLILGGVRSGKSRLAEQLAIDSRLAVTYIATATAQDDEMRARINSHCQQRPQHWQLIEEPIHLAAVLQAQAGGSQCLLVDCLTLWLTNLLMTEDEALFQREREALITVLPSINSELILVSNETNMGVMPLGKLTRRYCDEAGRLHQDIAQRCERVVMTVAGLPQILKGQPF
ncbi:MAG: bifunctional adenosylcobinamide kinase/adenosylcobinamide-phosphate guanylyltransferase [Cycloclasticus sp.]|nr:bifunctional adenosylcobinamide kinase/adenosylcobinamide-phosphate guanylyltransferase [Cycloclasticus sp.]